MEHDREIVLLRQFELPTEHSLLRCWFDRFPVVVQPDLAHSTNQGMAEQLTEATLGGGIEAVSFVRMDTEGNDHTWCALGEGECAIPVIRREADEDDRDHTGLTRAFEHDITVGVESWHIEMAVRVDQQDSHHSLHRDALREISWLVGIESTPDR